MSINTQTTREFFSNYNIASTGYVYNESGGANATTGWIDAKYDDICVQVCVATLDSSASIYYRIEGRGSSTGRKFDIYSETITSAQTVDKIINVTEQVKDIRFGVKTGVIPASFTASPVKVYASMNLCGKK